MSDDEEFQAEADEVYAELLVRIGEAAPQPRLEPTRKACELLGDPQRSAPVIHITGTNGKTSTSRMIEAILRAAGLKTGLLTSPHLVRVNERIVIDGLPVSNEALVRNWRDIAPYLAIVDAELVADGEEALSYFEALTVLGFAIFADAPVDVMVLEVGMGGEWDSTNVADGQVAVFTPIALDHQARLGNTVAEIARTKAGIIKPAATVVTAMQTLDALDELTEAAAHDEASMVVEMRDFALESTTVAVGGQVITVRGRAARYEELFLPLYGDYQGQNAAVAIAAVESFLGGGTVALSPDVLAEGLSTATSPGRLQLIGVEPTVFVDAAHNPHGAKALAGAMTEYFDFEQIAVVIAVLGDKDAHGVFAELGSIADRFHVTRSHSDRATPVDELAEVALTVAPEESVLRFDELSEAVDAARAWAVAGPSRAVLITGSITLVGEALALAESGGWKP
ncbi:bifunctional folylpolyglutamate synthase/dihydrofolate synthase [Pseudolysinimonas yzui]|uniref:tetrahydrofolate synthase n=1 Tax=Pseudolysinimonas yzui TaxID=2708254 RepID=A0A8J3M394_9MICO|nr:folylpolyglutamate synthase/dihydrofolate synthase family protein [Pseudolysinimonas yzui]GHF27533.1 dihydrofolate synthase [Pseudolysinimonas yzui]